MLCYVISVLSCNAIAPFWKEKSGSIWSSIEASNEVLKKLNSRGFRTALSTFSTLYTRLRHNLIKETLIDFIERTFQRKGAPYLASNDRNAFFTSQEHKMYTLWCCQEVHVSEAHTFLLDNINIKFGTKLYIQIVGIPTDINCAPLVADLVLFCYERDFMMPFSGDKETEIIQAFISTSRYLDDLLHIDNTYFDGMANHFTH